MTSTPYVPTRSLENCTTSMTASIIDAIRCLHVNGLRIVLIEENGILRGTISDGDIRRAILAGIPLDAAASTIMNAKPTTVDPSISHVRALEIMRKHAINVLPVVDKDGRILDLLEMRQLLTAQLHRNWVVLMAGGLGTRLRPLTETIPKPMVPVGGRPILETSIIQFAGQGYRELFISVNYKAEMIESYFGDGERYNVDINYIHEPARLGTAGALSLLPRRPDSPVIVMNADILTTLWFPTMVEAHERSGALATVALSERTYTVPFGVVSVEGDKVAGIEEKPSQNLRINSGIYVLSPEAFDWLKPNEYLDMPTLLSQMLAAGAPVGAWQIEGYWTDIGRYEDLGIANAKFGEIFGEVD